MKFKKNHTKYKPSFFITFNRHKIILENFRVSVSKLTIAVLTISSLWTGSKQFMDGPENLILVAMVLAGWVLRDLSYIKFWDPDCDFLNSVFISFQGVKMSKNTWNSCPEHEQNCNSPWLSLGLLPWYD